MEETNNNVKKKWYQKSFFQKLIHNKLYLLSFIVTVGFFGYMLNNGLKNSEGVITKRNKLLELIRDIDSSNDGFYKFEYKLDEEITIDSCTIDSYSFVYEVTGSLFTRYFYNKCVGTIKLGEEYNLEVNNDSFIVDNRIYKKMEKIDIKPTSSDIEFRGNSFIVLQNNDLILVSESNVYKNSDFYGDKTINNIEKRYYKISDNIYKFIVFYKDDVNENNTNLVNSEEMVYSIFQIEYDEKIDKFKTPVLIMERYGKDIIDKYSDDIKGLYI